MSPVIESVKEHITTFVDSINASSQIPIHLRLGLVTHEAAMGDRRGVWASAFTESVHDFKALLTGCEANSTGNEFGLPALDRALDFDWRPSCRRFVVSFTDEPVEGGTDVPFQLGKLPELADKFHALRVAGYLIGPACPNYDAICAGPKMVRVVMEHGDLSTYDFSKFLSELGRTVSASPEEQVPSRPAPNLYGI